MSFERSAPALARTASGRPEKGCSGLAGLAPLGIALQIELGEGIDPAVIGRACRGWQGVAEQGGPVMRLRVRLLPDLTGSAEPDIVVDGRTLRLSGEGARGSAEVETMTAHCAVSAAYCRDPERLRENVLDALVLFVLAHRDRTPIHAAGFIAGDLAILAGGPSGAGKSSLALAADARDWPVLSDDTVYFQALPQPKIWGIARAAHLLLAGSPDPAERIRTRNGKQKRVVGFRANPPRTLCAERAALCVLAFGPRAALAPISREEALRRLGPPEPGFDLFIAESRRAHASLTANGAWLLTLSADPAEAIEVLAANLDRLKATAMQARAT